MTKPDQSDESEVGYCRPPKHSQFKKGASGNPKGRPKGSNSISKVFDKVLSRKVPVRIDGRSRSMAALEAALTRIVNDAAGGNEKQAANLLRHLQRHEPQGTPAAADRDGPGAPVHQPLLIVPNGLLTKEEWEAIYGAAARGECGLQYQKEFEAKHKPLGRPALDG